MTSKYTRTPLDDLLSLPPTTTLSHLSRRHSGELFICLCRTRDSWPRSNSGVSVGGVWGYGQAQTLAEAVTLAAAKLTEAETDRLTKLNRKIPELTIEDLANVKL